MILINIKDMAIGLLGIASGAVKVGQKIFQGIKNRKEKKIEKRAAALVEAQEKKAAVEGKFGALFSTMGANEGTQAISGSGNFLAGIKGAFTTNKAIENFQPQTGAQAVAQQNNAAAAASGGGMNPMYLIAAGAILLLFVFKKR